MKKRFVAFLLVLIMVLGIAGIGDGGWQRSYCARQRRKSNKDL